MSTVVNWRARLHDGGAQVTKRVPGEAGVWVFILGDMTIFGILFATFLFYRAKRPDIFAESQTLLNQNYGAVNTVLLLVSSLFVVLAVRAVRANLNLAPALLLGAFACGVAFSVLKVIEYADKAGHGIGINTNDFFMFYYVLTGLHWFHVLVGLLVVAFLFSLSRKSTMTTQQRSIFEGGACFWHMVDLLWIVLFPLLYLAK